MKKRRFLIFGILLILMTIFFAVLELSEAISARMLEKKCTRKTVGKVCDTGWRSGGGKGPSIDYFVAEYEVNDVPYKTQGMGNAVKGTVVTVWYDPKLPFNSYAGDSPIKDSIVTVISYLIACIAVMVIGIAAVGQYIRDRN